MCILEKSIRQALAFNHVYARRTQTCKVLKLNNLPYKALALLSKFIISKYINANHAITALDVGRGLDHNLKL